MRRTVGFTIRSRYSCTAPWWCIRTTTPVANAYGEKRLEQATRCYESALKTLARVRKLSGNHPLLQLNVGAQQVITNA